MKYSSESIYILKLYRERILQEQKFSERTYSASFIRNISFIADRGLLYIVTVDVLGRVQPFDRRHWHF